LTGIATKEESIQQVTEEYSALRETGTFFANSPTVRNHYKSFWEPKL
jgi:hypothetical protein